MSNDIGTTVELPDVYRFNRDDVVAATIAQMCVEERERMPYEDGAGPWPEWNQDLALLEGYCLGYINRWEQPGYSAFRDERMMWKNICDLMVNIMPLLWD